jgi:uncharacterized membrane protein
VNSTFQQGDQYSKYDSKANQQVLIWNKVRSSRFHMQKLNFYREALGLLTLTEQYIQIESFVLFILVFASMVLFQNERVQ